MNIIVVLIWSDYALFDAKIVLRIIGERFLKGSINYRI